MKAVSERIVEIEKWVERAKPRDRFVYHIGFPGKLEREIAELVYQLSREHIVHVFHVPTGKAVDVMMATDKYMGRIREYAYVLERASSSWVNRQARIYGRSKR